MGCASGGCLPAIGFIGDIPTVKVEVVEKLACRDGVKTLVGSMFRCVADPLMMLLVILATIIDEQLEVQRDTVDRARPPPKLLLNYVVKQVFWWSQMSDYRFSGDFSKVTLPNFSGDCVTDVSCSPHLSLLHTATAPKASHPTLLQQGQSA